MTEQEVKIKIMKYLAGYTFFNNCDIEFGNSTYSDEIPLYARLLMGLRITPREIDINKETNNEISRRI